MRFNTDDFLGQYIINGTTGNNGGLRSFQLTLSKHMGYMEQQ